MRRHILKLHVLFILIFSLVGISSSTKYKLTKKEISDIYKEAGLNENISYDSFKKACTGYNNLPYSSKIIAIIDFSLPSYKKRFAVIDLEKRKLLYQTYTAHGKNTGNLYATHFSNKNDSLKSSLGFYKTGQTYQGKYGYSLRLLGLEKGINDQALNRAIVIHPAEYVYEEFIRRYKMSGRSWGCPALPPKVSSKIINCIKGGQYLFIYAKKEDYFNSSNYLK